MKIVIFRTRMAMNPPACSYDVLVPEKDCPDYILTACPGGCYHTRIHRDGEIYLSYMNATSSQEHEEMEQGWERYEDWKRHEKQAHLEMLAIGRNLFPELRDLPKNLSRIPLFVPVSPNTKHAKKYITKKHP